MGLVTVFVDVVRPADDAIASLTPPIHFASLKLRYVATDREEEKSPQYPNPERSSDG